MIGRGIAALAGTVALGAAVAPTAALMPTVAPGVKVGGVSVGGLTSAAARMRIEAAVTRRVRVSGDRQHWILTPWSLGAVARVDATLATTLAANTGSAVDLQVRVDPKALSAVVDRLGRRLDEPAVDAQLLGLDAKGKPRVSVERTGLTLNREATARLLVRTLADGKRKPVALPLRVLEPRVTRADFGPVIVIDRGSNTLRLYDGKRLVRLFRVATGQARYPTPAGVFRVVRMQANPWWYPPPSPWARGLSPVPPGPGNPLGTRWMGLSAPGVGIHGTPSDASIGYSASHGCIRMHIPEAVWLFEHVHVGAPVVIV